MAWISLAETGHLECKSEMQFNYDVSGLDFQTTVITNIDTESWSSNQEGGKGKETTECPYCYVETLIWEAGSYVTCNVLLAPGTNTGEVCYRGKANVCDINLKNKRLRHLK